MDELNYSRRIFLKSAAFTVSSLILSESVWADKKTSQPPNIVFILADDQGLHQLGCYGNKFYETPNIDRLAAEGMKFTDAYAACPVCSPTRASIMTGKYPARLHLTDFIRGHPITGKLKTPPWRKFLPAEEITIAEALEPAGYVSGHFGKWHLNKDKNYSPGRALDPGSQGFDDVLTTKKPPEDADPKTDAHHVRQITAKAISFIESNKDQPFFCYVSHNSIHDPRMENPDLVAKYKKKPGSDDPKNNPVIAAMVETLDKSVGVILDKLEELKIADDTIVVYFSDNGCNYASDKLKPLRGGKAQLYEGGIKMPLIIRWPAVVKPATQCSAVVSSIDFFPTFIETAGLKLEDPAVDGESLLPLLTQSAGLKRDAIYWHYPHYHYLGIAPCGAVRIGKYKLIEWFEKSVDGIDTPGALELYNLQTDISEQNNLAEKMPEITARLYNQLKKWRKSVNAQQMSRSENAELKNFQSSNHSWSPEAKGWALGCSAVLNERNRCRHDMLLPCDKNEKNINKWKRNLESSWGITTRADLLGTLDSLENNGHRKRFNELGKYIQSLNELQYQQLIEDNKDDHEKLNDILTAKEYYHRLGEKGLLGWDFSRYICLCRWGYMIGYLSAEEAWQKIMPVAQLLQKKFDSWQDMGQNYLIGRKFWSYKETKEIGNLFEDAFQRLVDMRSSPWNKYPWDMDLTVDTKN